MEITPPDTLGVQRGPLRGERRGEEVALRDILKGEGCIEDVGDANLTIGVTRDVKGAIGSQEVLNASSITDFNH